MKRENDSPAVKGSADIKYAQTFYGPQFRPNARMPIEAHAECGLLLKQVAIAAEGRAGAREPVNYARGSLDDWAMREYTTTELPNKLLQYLYLPGPNLALSVQFTPDELIDKLFRSKDILELHYREGKALGKLLRELDHAVSSLRKWDGKPRGKIYRVIAGKNPSTNALQA